MNDEHPHSRRGFFRCASLAGSLLSGVAARGQTQRPRYDLLVRGGRAGGQPTNTSAESKSTRRLATTRPSGSATSSKRTWGPPCPGLWPWLEAPEAIHIADEDLVFGGWSRAECLLWILLRLYGTYSARKVCIGSTVAAFHAGRALATAPIARSRAAALT